MLGWCTGIGADRVSEGRGESLTIVGQRLPDLVRLVEDQLLATKFPMQLTRPTVRSILAVLPLKVRRRAIDDPDRWARLVAAAIRTVTIEEMVKHISWRYESIRPNGLRQPR